MTSTGQGGHTVPDGKAAAHATLARLTFGYVSAQVVATAVRLGVMDHLDADPDGERGANEVAAELGTHTHATLRLLRALAALGLLAEPVPGQFSLTAAGALLRGDRPDSQRDFVRLMTDPVVTRGFDHLDDSVRTGGTSFDRVFGTDCFSYLRDHPELSALFNAGMSQGTHATAAVLPGRYDFSRFGTVVDVGGGDGTLLAAVLRAHQDVRGILMDSAEGLAQAPATLEGAGAGVVDRCALHPGDFFTAVPPGGDAYMMKSVIHNWDDDDCVTILRHCREALPGEGSRGRVLLVERVLPPTVDLTAVAPADYLRDLNMLVNVGGQERTLSDFEDLFARSGLALTDVIPLPPTGFNLLEATPAEA